MLDAWKKKIRELLSILKLNNSDNVRGAKFEMAGLISIRPDCYFRSKPDFKFKEIAPKDLDIGFINEQRGIEFYSPKRQAVPIAEIENVNEDEAQRRLNAALRRGTAIDETISMLANTKLHSKSGNNFSGEIFLLIDSSGTDIIEDYFDQGELQIQNIRLEFSEFCRQQIIQGQKSKPNIFFGSQNLVVGIVDRNEYFFKTIYLINGSPEQKRWLSRVFWLSTVD